MYTHFSKILNNVWLYSSDLLVNIAPNFMQSLFTRTITIIEVKESQRVFNENEAKIRQRNIVIFYVSHVEFFDKQP